MFHTLMQNVDQYIQTNLWLAFAAVFIGGVLTAAAPCVLAMIPLMISFVAGGKDAKAGPLRGLGYSALFVLGLAITFTILGIAAALASRMYGEVSGIWNWVVAVVCLVMGLHLIGVLKFTIPVPVNMQPKTKGAVGAFLMGLLFGVVSAPCAAPMLVVILTYLTRPDSSVLFGALLLMTYAFGHSVLIMVAGTSMGAAKKLIESKKLTRATDIMRRCAGGLIILVGAYFLSTLWFK